MYEAYKPFRNYLRQFPMVSSLTHVWLIAQHLDGDRELPPDLRPPRSPFGQHPTLKGEVYSWDLDVLAREIVLNAPKSGKRSLGSHRELATAINHIRRLENVAINEFFADGGDVIREMHRVIHRQFPWQSPPNRVSLARYAKIFGGADVASFVEAELGLSVKQLYQLAFAVCGYFVREPGILTNASYEVLNIAPATSQSFFERFTISLEELHLQTREQQHYDGRWLYCWNPLHAKPLISVDPNHPERVICPLPSLLLRRVSEGLFYDLASVRGFGDAFGQSFQAYIGEVLSAVCEPSRFAIYCEEEYRVGKHRKDGVDWILEDEAGILFIECKTSRLRQDAKINSDTVALEAMLDRLAAAIVQNYKNILDALEGKTTWRPSGKPAYPLLVTLEDWWIFGSTIHEFLEDSVRRKLQAANVDAGLVDSMPYTVASAADLEIAIHAIDEVGILQFMRAKTDGEHRGWAVSPFSMHEYPQAASRARQTLFKDALDELVPEP